MEKQISKINGSQCGREWFWCICFFVIEKILPCQKMLRKDRTAAERKMSQRCPAASGQSGQARTFFMCRKQFHKKLITFYEKTLFIWDKTCYTIVVEISTRLSRWLTNSQKKEVFL